MDAASSRLKRACGIHMKWEQVFDPVTLKIDRKYANVWLEDLPDLSVECSVTKVSELLGEKIKDLINLWNALEDAQNSSKLNILSAANGLGKSIYLYLIAVFARHFGIPVQYIGNTGDLLREKVDDDLVACNYVGNTGATLRKKFDYKLVARKYAAMLLFMNSGTLDSLEPFYSGRPRYDFLQGFAIKLVAYYAFVKGDLVLCDELRRNFMNMPPRNLLIIDEHNALWQKFGSDTKTWLPFFKFYADPVAHATRYCKFVIAGSQHHEFESNLPSGYEFSVQNVEPLSLEEFAIWERLDDYPETFRDNESTVVDCTGFVPGMIAELIGMSRSFPNLSFGEVAARFYEECYADMQIVHSEYVKSLTHEVSKKQFYDGLHKLFRGRETPAITLFDSAYRDRGLLIAMNDGSLQFYNSIAFDILYESFSNYYVTKERILELSKRFKESQMADADGGEF
ncbi:hypothetical protein GAYE_SCF27MG4703 [Galdieria yellowstonensis]|uniref:Archaeal ATPase n=1 Tax=Galdieria yellowstonensis TaxID=3028027 RepID=A0AAV9IHT3_9RHOD|nr:hypothetical protein GAYE_SCF27MG4703 [Galdieria yellowstonensis]